MNNRVSVIFVSVCQGVSVDEWYSQVQQLRREAEDYKRRGQQTHFSRHHLAQLSARNAQLWDVVSNHRCVLHNHRYDKNCVID